MPPRPAKPLVCAAVLALAAPAAALPRVGDEPGAARVEDADGKGLETRSFSGRPVLVFYEDKETSKQNAAAKSDLRALAGETKAFAKLAMLPVADVSAYDFWPAKGFVKQAIREESARSGLPVYCDWDGGFRGAWKLRRAAASVVLVGRDGRVLFAAEGVLPEDARRRLIELVRAEIGA